MRAESVGNEARFCYHQGPSNPLGVRIMPADKPYELIREHLPGMEEPIEKMILDSVNEGVITLECNGVIHSVNRAAARILDLDEEGLLGKTFGEVFGGEPENEHFRTIIEGVFDHALHTKRTETRFKRPDGQTVDLSVATSSLLVDECRPGMESVVLVFRDITAFKALERVRRRAVDHLSHELKTPLSVIEGSLNGLLNHDSNHAIRTRTAERIRRNLKRLREIERVVEQILKPLPYVPRNVDIVSETRGILEELSAEHAHRSVTVTVAPSQVEWAFIDPDVFALVLRALVKNAVEVTPDEGEIVVSLEHREPGLLLKVDDRGVGITVRDQEFLFDGFHHTQETEEYSTKKPFDFNAGGKGLELMRLKALSEAGYFDISYRSDRCRYIPTALDHCPGRISDCPHVTDRAGCRESGGTTFYVQFHNPAKG